MRLSAALTVNLPFKSLVCFTLLFYVACCYAQPPETKTLRDTVSNLLPPENAVIRLSNPTRAALLSATLPGAGQVYNGTAWKTPIIYAGFGTLGFLINRDHNNYVRFRNAIFLLNDGDPDTNPGGVLNGISETNLVRGRDFYRRQRDFNIILVALWYGLNVAEAAVHAHLKNFDVSDDLSASLQPKIGFYGEGYANPYFGAGLTLTIR